MDRLAFKRRLRARIAVPVGLVAAIVTALAVSATVGFAAPSRAAVAPNNTAAPTITGTAKVGQTLTAHNGTWTGTAPITYTYQWQRCDENGGSCADISAATDDTYVLKAVDQGNTLRLVVTGKNADGTDKGTSVPTAVIGAAAETTPTPAPATGTGCPKTTQASQAVAVADVTVPARLQVDQFQVAGGPLTLKMQSFTLRVHVSSTCGNPVSGAKVYATAVPFNQVTIPAEATTGSDGWVDLTYNKMAGFPVSSKQQLLAMFIRASKPGDPVLAGISTRRLVSLRVTHG
jgi:hypothetical protein